MIFMSLWLVSSSLNAWTYLTCKILSLQRSNAAIVREVMAEGTLEEILLRMFRSGHEK